MDKEEIKSKILVGKYPQTLNECLEWFEKLNYNSNGADRYFMLEYHYKTKDWYAYLRYPMNVENPTIKSASPLEACHNLFDSIKKTLESQKRVAEILTNLTNL